MEEKSDFSHYLSDDREAIEIKQSDGFVVVAGYGIVGKVVCDLLDEKFIKYVGLEVDPDKAIQARNKGLPVFYGDISRPEVSIFLSLAKNPLNRIILKYSYLTSPVRNPPPYTSLGLRSF